MGCYSEVEVKNIGLRKSRSCKLVYCKDYTLNVIEKKIVSLIARSSKLEKNHQQMHG